MIDPHCQGAGFGFRVSEQFGKAGKKKKKERKKANKNDNPKTSQPANKQIERERERETIPSSSQGLQAAASWEAERMKYASHRTKQTKLLGAGKL